MYFDQLGLALSIGMLVASILYLAAFVMAFIRIVVGPSIFDRVIALDMVGGLCLGLIVLFAIYFEQPVLLDAAFAIAVVGFLGTVAFARYLERGGGDS